LIKVLDMVIGVVAVLVAAVVAVFLILLGINVALVHKLRSIIPLPPDARAGGRTPRRARHR
jgi:hypothetical protein